MVVRVPALPQIVSAVLALTVMIGLPASVRAADAAPDGAEVVLFDARVFTAEPQHPYAEAVAIRGDRIVGVGTSAAVTALVGPLADPSTNELVKPYIDPAIYQAETRRGPQGVLDETQRMPREAMLYAYTRNAAAVLDLQDQIGSIAAGKLADLVLVDRDVLTVPVDELKDARVVWTMFGGRAVFGTAPL